jgi:hypothetical protein
MILAREKYKQFPKPNLFTICHNLQYLETDSISQRRYHTSQRNRTVGGYIYQGRKAI